MDWLGFSIVIVCLLVSGFFTLVALSFYQAPELCARLKLAVSNLRLTRSR